MIKRTQYLITVEYVVSSFSAVQTLWYTAKSLNEARQRAADFFERAYPNLRVTKVRSATKEDAVRVGDD